MPKERVLVVGNVNLETALRLDTFPLKNASSYQPHRLEMSVSGVGFNVARVLQALGTEVRLASVIGSDTVGDLVRLTFTRLGMDPTYLCAGRRTGRSLVLSDTSGARHVHTDLGGVADATYPAAHFDAALTDCGLAVLTNINYTRPLLERVLTAGIPISTDLHAIHDLNNPYDEDFLAAATLVFFSGEHLPDAFQTVTELRTRFSPEIVVVGLGARGALLSERGRETVHVPAFRAPRVVNTVGAGDALHAAFCHFWLKGEHPEQALRLACAFAAHKIGFASGGRGFVSEAEVRTFASVHGGG